MPSLVTIVVFLITTLFAPASPPAPNPCYTLSSVSLPDNLRLEVSGMAFLPDGSLALAIRKGQVWILKHPDEPAKRKFVLFASGLHEPLGLAWHNNSLFTAQRTELTQLIDSDQDGQADRYNAFATGWGVSGNYHEYAYGPVFDHQGNAWVTLNCTIGRQLVDNSRWRGWSLRVSPDGTWNPVSGGFRSPSGLGLNAAGDLFVTDQQGNWFGTGALLHVQSGAFHGHADALVFCSLPGSTFTVRKPVPETLTVAQAARQIPAYQLPAVWFPYRKMGMSATDLLCDSTQGMFGPFTNQLFVGEFTMSAINRVFLEKIDGKYQGACFPFVAGLQCAALRLAWSPSHRLFIGQSNRGWNSLGTSAYGLQVISWTGRTPFDIREMRALPGGFDLTFTLPLNPATATDPDHYKLSSYTYRYHSKYGSDEVDAAPLSIDGIELLPDGHTVRIKANPLRAGYVHELALGALTSQNGDFLVQSNAYYTLNRVPRPSAGEPANQ